MHPRRAVGWIDRGRVEAVCVSRRRLVEAGEEPLSCGGGHVGGRGSCRPAVLTFLIRSVVTLRFGRTLVCLALITFVMFKLGLFATPRRNFQ